MAVNPNRNLRRQHLERRRALDDDYRSAASREIARKVIRSRDFARARCIAAYFSLIDEVDVDLVIRAAWWSGKTVCAPCVGPRGSMSFRRIGPHTPMVQNALGIREPARSPAVAAQEIDLVIVPLVAFDAAMHRIGMGGGYYDRYFAFTRYRHKSLPPRLLGVAFACQRASRITAAPWDVSLSRVVCDDD